MPSISAACLARRRSDRDPPSMARFPRCGFRIEYGDRLPRTALSVPFDTTTARGLGSHLRKMRDAQHLTSPPKVLSFAHDFGTARDPRVDLVEKST